MAYYYVVEDVEFHNLSTQLDFMGERDYKVVQIFAGLNRGGRASIFYISTAPGVAQATWPPAT